MNNKIIEFYTNKAPNSEGFFFEDIVLWCNDDLENNHLYIQWLFPLTEPSQFNPDAPLLDEETIDAFVDNKTCMDNITFATERMMDFYGFAKRKRGHFAGIRTAPGKIYLDHITISKPFWITHKDHNYMRLTRILKCLNLFGLVLYVEMLYELLTQMYESFKDEIGAETQRFWYSAAFMNDNYNSIDDSGNYMMTCFTPFTNVFRVYNG